MVYGRTIGTRTLDLEPSGALMSASLVMRDRQTDSWWSIMSSRAIGGPLEGTALEELPVGEKATWGDWRQRHPDTLVLSVGGVEHEENNPYDRYFGSEDTFRDLAVDDRRLPAKEPIFAFWLSGEPWAVPHSAFAGGRLFEVGTPGRKVLLHRSGEASFYQSTRAWLVPVEVAAAAASPAQLAERLLAGSAGGDPLPGFDTFWYTWVAVNRGTRLLP